MPPANVHSTQPEKEVSLLRPWALSGGRGDAHSQSENNSAVHGLFTQTRRQSRHMGLMPHPLVLNPVSHTVTHASTQSKVGPGSWGDLFKLLHVNPDSLCSFHLHTRSQRLGPQTLRLSSWLEKLLGISKETFQGEVLWLTREKEHALLPTASFHVAKSLDRKLSDQISYR